MILSPLSVLCKCHYERQRSIEQDRYKKIFGHCKIILFPQLGSNNHYVTPLAEETPLR